MHDAFDSEVQALLASGNKIGAIKRYREKTGIGLAEAKTAVESMQAGRSHPEDGRSADSDLTDQIVGLLGRGETISAVKLYRDQTGGSLKEAKSEVDRIGKQLGIRTSSGIGCLGVVLFWGSVVVGLLS